MRKVVSAPGPQSRANIIVSLMGGLPGSGVAIAGLRSDSPESALLRKARSQGPDIRTAESYNPRYARLFEGIAHRRSVRTAYQAPARRGLRSIEPT